jgi:hypothetical protein
MEPQQYCFACRICIGPFYMESSPVPIGDKILCGHCAAMLGEQGHLILDAYTCNINTARKLMPDGTVIGKRQPADD